MKIYKKILKLGINEIRDCSKILSVHGQGNDTACIWFESFLGAPVAKVQVALTGEEVPQGDFIGTFLINDGEFVGHVYKLPTE